MYFHRVRIKFELRDLWIGVYWNVRKAEVEDYTSHYYDDNYHKLQFLRNILEIYICILPLLPIKLEVFI